tara:strand:+ start:4549 stop:4977 length:429 start_codon:yes stop_codon:yes gene_type:complete
MNKYKIDKSGKSLAIFVKDFIPIISAGEFNKLIKYKKNVRFCLHKSRNNKLQCMINLIKKDSQIKMHKHNKEEVYCVFKGNLSISIKIKNKIRKIVMSEKKNKILYMPKNIMHSIEAKSNYCIFLELTSGPFSRKNTRYEKN